MVIFAKERAAVEAATETVRDITSVLVFAVSTAIVIALTALIVALAHD